MICDGNIHDGEEKGELPSNIPRHVAIIMDGNGRWAAKRDLPRVEGHQEGAKSVRRVLEESKRVGIRYLTLYAFSSENWERPQAEVHALMELFAHYLEKERETFLKERIRLRSIGDRSRLPLEVQKRLSALERDTEHCECMDLVLAVSYGGRDEIIRAWNSLASRRVDELCQDKPKDASLTVTAEELREMFLVQENSFSENLDTRGIPDPDLLIRTSGEFRISNFLLWQLAYTEIVVSDCLWPDFSKEEFRRCLWDYSKRERRFGKRLESKDVRPAQNGHAEAEATEPQASGESGRPSGSAL